MTLAVDVLFAPRIARMQAPSITSNLSSQMAGQSCGQTDRYVVDLAGSGRSIPCCCHENVRYGPKLCSQAVSSLSFRPNCPQWRQQHEHRYAARSVWS